MLDDLQDFDDSSAFLDELEDLGTEEIEEFGEPITVPGEGLLFGMRPIQRFIIALEFFFLACILSSLCLLIFEKISPPFM